MSQSIANRFFQGQRYFARRLRPVPRRVSTLLRRGVDRGMDATSSRASSDADGGDNRWIELHSVHRWCELQTAAAGGRGRTQKLAKPGVIGFVLDLLGPRAGRAARQSQDEGLRCTAPSVPVQQPGRYTQTEWALLASHAPPRSILSARLPNALGSSHYRVSRSEATGHWPVSALATALHEAVAHRRGTRY